jgi:hypothetical protein
LPIPAFKVEAHACGAPSRTATNTQHFDLGGSSQYEEVGESRDSIDPWYEDGSQGTVSTGINKSNRRKVKFRQSWMDFEQLEAERHQSPPNEQHLHETDVENGAQINTEVKLTPELFEHLRQIMLDRPAAWRAL